MSMGAWTDWHAVVMDDPEEAVSVLREQDQAIERLTAENAALRAERALIIQRAENAEAALAYAASTGDECAIEVEALRKDAERYRWLRDSAGNDIMEKLMAECSPPRWDELVDAAIDAAMGEKP